MIYLSVSTDQHKGRTQSCIEVGLALFWDRRSQQSQKRECSVLAHENLRGLPQRIESILLLILNLKSSTYLPWTLYRAAITAGAGALFGEDRYPVTVFFALTLLTTISNNMGSLPLKN
jgi:hypothetical protein